MPNHVHVLIETLPDWPLSGVVQAWKSVTAKRINRALERTGIVWQTDYFDRYVRDDFHLAAMCEYIRENPVKAGLVQDAREWGFSSASRSKDNKADGASALRKGGPWPTYL